MYKKYIFIYIVILGNSNPRFMRLTLYSIPNTEDLLQTSHLPLGVILQPMARLRNDEVDF